MGPDIVSSDLSQTVPDHRIQPAVRRVEIDTSAPFESVKEAANRFGGMGFWKPYQLKLSQTTQADIEETDIVKLEEQAAELEKDLMLKETETLEFLKEIEAIKTVVEELRSKLMQKESHQECDEPGSTKSAEKDDFGGGHTGLVLTELNQAKMSLSRTTDALADIRASVKLLNKKLEKERKESLNRSSLTVKSAEAPEISRDSSDNLVKICEELQRLSSEAEKFKRLGEKARWVVIRAMGEIEQTNDRIKTAEIRLVAARKMKEAARAAEAVALAEIKSFSRNAEAVTISFEEYSLLNQKANEAEEFAMERAGESKLKVDEEEVTNAELLMKVDEAVTEIRTSKKELEETLERIEAANDAKLDVEAEFRKWIYEKGQRRRSSAHNTTKFKNSNPNQHKIDTCLLSQNAVNLIDDGSSSSVAVSKQPVSIGQILSRKLLLADEARMDMGQPLGQLLGKIYCNAGKENSKRLSGKRKMFGFVKLSAVMNKPQNAKKKKMDLDLR